MAKFKHHFATRFSGFACDCSYSPSGVRSVSEREVRYYETGRITILPHFDGKPDEREDQLHHGIENVSVYLAKDPETPQLYAPDGTKVPKGSLVNNPALWLDEDYGIALFASNAGRQPNAIVYNGPDAMPYTQIPIVSNTADEARVKELLAVVETLTAADRAAHRMDLPFDWGEVPENQRVGAAKPSAERFFKHPGEMTYNRYAAYYLRDEDTAYFRTNLREHHRKIIAYPYLLTRKPNGGWLK